MTKIRNDLHSRYYTTGQTAKLLRVSVSTLKRWVREYSQVVPALKRNSNGWKLFSQEDIQSLKDFQKDRKKQGRIFRDSVLKPVDK